MKTLSLFSGAGGLDIGFHRAGFDIIGCVEIEKQYCETLRVNRNNGTYFNPDAKIFCDDIRNFNPNEFVDKDIECVIGGPPCQPFSAAGRRSGGVPGIEAKGIFGSSVTLGIDLSNPHVYGCRASEYIIFTSAYSTVFPAYITMTVSHIFQTTPKLCVTNIIDEFDSFCRFFINPNTWA